MDRQQKNHVTIIGCGVAGSVLAILLAQKGFTVNLYERSSRKDIFDTASKRSYNLTFFSYGITLMKKIGLWEVVQPNLIQLEGSTTQITKHAKPIFTPVHHNDAQYYAISRSKLLEAIVTFAEKEPLISIHYDTSLLHINRDEREIVLQDLQTKKIRTESCAVLFGADGVNSLVRSFIQQGQETHHSQEYATWNYKQFALSKASLAKLQLQPKVVHSWTREHGFMISIPNFDESLSALLVLPKGKKGFTSLNTKEAIEAYITNLFPALLPAVDEIVPALLTNPIGSFVTIHTEPWFYKDFMAVLGDSAHGFYPFFGQGTSAAFGDCISLLKLIDEHGTDWAKIFPLYQADRKRQMDALGELSKEGLISYRRHRKADYHAIYTTLEMAAHKIFPNIIQPPVYLPATNDPEHTDDHVKRYAKQKRLAKLLGVPLAVRILTKMVAMYEDTSNTLKKQRD